MATPIFERQNSTVKGVFASDTASISFGRAGAGVQPLSGVLVQSLQVQYSQQVSRLYDLSGNGARAPVNVYYVGGRTTGNASMARVVGPDATIKEVYSRFGNICNVKNNDLNLTMSQADCSSDPRGTFVGPVQNGSLRYALTGVLMTALTLGVQSQDMIINESTQLMFAGMDYA